MDASDVARALGFNRYDDSSGASNLGDYAARQLEGRSYYYSKGTRGFFNARVSCVRAERCGMILATVESLVAPGGTRRQSRGVAFDLLGNVIHRTEFFSTTATALKSLGRWLAEYHDTAAEIERVIAVQLRVLREKVARIEELAVPQ